MGIATATATGSQQNSMKEGRGLECRATGQEGEGSHRRLRRSGSRNNAAAAELHRQLESCPKHHPKPHRREREVEVFEVLSFGAQPGRWESSPVTATPLPQ